jgi:hypothetical protein
MEINDCKGCLSGQYLSYNFKDKNVCEVLYVGELEIIKRISMCPCTNCIIKMICIEECTNYRRYVIETNTNIFNSLTISKYDTT